MAVRQVEILCRLIAILSCFIAGYASAQTYQPYRFSIVGHPQNVVHAPPDTPSLVLMGGGENVDEAFRWMIGKSGGGNFVVIGADNSDEYNQYIYRMGGVSSVETLIIPSRKAAHDPFVIARIRAADALFIAGGDQSDYLRYWKNTPVQDAIQYLANRNVPIGGISAGIAILGQHVFTAERGTIDSATALADPYHGKITLDHDFLMLHGLNGVITDTHLETRKRLGRLVSFMARIAKDGMLSAIRGIGVDTETALVIDNNIAIRLGKPAGAVYFLSADGPPEVCEPAIPLSYRDITVQRLEKNERFDLGSWSKLGSFREIYSISVLHGSFAVFARMADRRGEKQVFH